jgi:molecular chaperone GrpE
MGVSMSEEKQTNSNQNQEAAGDESVVATITDLASQKQIEELKVQVEKHRNDFLYLRAEFDNYKKHAIKERSELSKYGSERLLIEVLGVIDNFDRALDMKPTPENIDTYAQGVRMTANELKTMVQRFGITEISCEGGVFDPMIHEALGAEETDTVKEGHIFRVFKKAYKLHDKIIRPAQVIVAKTKNKAN